MTRQADAIVIGTGQSGPSLASTLAGEGRRVAIAEGYRFGGSCVNYGCRPTKTLIASAHAAHMARRGADFGVRIDHFEIDWGRVRERVVGIIDETSASTERWLRETEGMDVYHAYAHFDGKTDDGRYRVQMGDGGEVVEAPQVFINTGTRAVLPQIDGVDQVEWLDSEKILRLEHRPDHLIVLGGSYIGLEFAQAMRRLGAQVTLVETSECIINREDADLKRELYRVLTDEGVVIHTHSRITRVEPVEGGGVRATLHSDETDAETIVTGTHWLIAVGRVPNSDRLNLESVGVERDGRGYIVVDERLATSAPGVYALGDVNGKGAFTHTSYQDYEIVRDNLLYGRDRKWTDRTMAYALYTDPPLGRVGMSETEARKSGRRVLMAVKPMADIGRAVEQAETAGLIKLLVDADSEQFVGAAVLGFHGDDVVQVISYYMATGATYHPMRDALPIHPTIAEFMPTLLGELKPLT